MTSASKEPGVILILAGSWHLRQTGKYLQTLNALAAANPPVVATYQFDAITIEDNKEEFLLKN